MSKKFFFSMLLVMMALVTNAQSLVGAWSGELKVSPQMSLKLVFHVNQDKSILMDSPDQGAYGIPCETVYLSADSISMKVPKIMMSYSGHLNGDRIEGVFQQGGMSLPLNLTSGEKKANRPQTPSAPFPYSTEDVIINHDDVSLAGTLTIPANVTKQTPVLVMVTGSGQQNRDEELFEHKPFAVIADYLARNGIATLRYDDRGVGGSTGDVTSATTADFAKDAASVVDFIKSGKRFGKVGLLGHSEGGLIAYMLGAKPKMLDFIVSIAGPAVRGDSILDFQFRHALAKSGITGSDADKFVDEAFKKQASNQWMQYFMGYSPAEDLKALKIPALIIYGEKDTQVPAAMNVSAARQYAPNASVKVYPYANHLMQHATTGQLEEYKTIEETISPEVLSDIVAFINACIK